MVQFEQVSDSVWAHTKGKTRGNVAFIKLGESLVMIDSGMDPITIRKFREKAEEMTHESFKYLVITHHHPDHVFGNQIFEDCEIIATKAVYEIMKKNKESVWKRENLQERMKKDPELREKWENLRIVLPSHTFEEEYTIRERGESLKIVETHGHTRGSVYVFLPDDEIVIAGDLLFAKTYPYAGDPTADPYAWVQALHEIKKLRPKKIVPGHGPITTVKELTLHQEYLESLIDKMEARIKKGITKDELDSYEWAEFPYKTDAKRRASMMAHMYETVKKKLEKSR